MKLLEIKSIYSDCTVDRLNEEEIKKYVRETSLSKLVKDTIDNLNYSNRIDFKEGKKQVVQLSVITTGTMTGQLEGTNVYCFLKDEQGLYQY